jgi:hypothetical protein
VKNHHCIINHKKIGYTIKGQVYKQQKLELLGYNITISIDKEHRTIIDHQKIGYTIKDQVYKQQKLELLRIQHNYQHR